MRAIIYGSEKECQAKIKATGQAGWQKASKEEHKEHAQMFGFDAQKVKCSYYNNRY